MKDSKELIVKATEIYISGYKARDKIIEDILKESHTGTPVYIVSNTSA